MIRVLYHVREQDVQRPAGMNGGTAQRKELGPEPDGFLMELWLTDQVGQAVRPQTLQRDPWRTYLGELPLGSATHLCLDVNVSYGGKVARQRLVEMVAPACWVLNVPPAVPTPALVTPPATQATASPSAELHDVFAKSLIEYRQAKGGESWLPIPPSADWHKKGLYQSEAIDALANRLNKQADAKQIAAYTDAARKMLDDSDPATRGMACVFLGLLCPRVLDAGLPPRLGDLLNDNAEALPGWLTDYPPPQQRWQPEPPPKPTKLTVGNLAACCLLATTDFEFKDPKVFAKWWQFNSDYQDRLWYWVRRWLRQSSPDSDLPEMFARNPQHALMIVVLVGYKGFLEDESRLPWANEVVNGGVAPIQMENVQWSFAQPSPQAVAELVAKYKLRPQLLDIIQGKFDWPFAPHNEEEQWIAAAAALPILAAASTKSDATEILDLMRHGKGPATSHYYVKAGLAKLAASLDQDHAVDILLEQLDRNPTLEGLVVELIKADGLRHWGHIKSSYRKTRPDHAVVIVDALATLKPAEASPKLAELMEASSDALSIKLDKDGYAHDQGDYGRLFLAYVNAAASVNGGKPVLDDKTVEAACAVFGKVQMSPPEIETHDRAAVAARAVAVAKLLEFFRSNK